jgi:transcriptional regulator with XRE-family HTH domain
MGSPNGFKQRVGERIKTLREARGLSQPQLARLMSHTGGNGSQISRWERGHQFPNPANVSALARAFGVTEEELLCGPERRRRR